MTTIQPGSHVRKLQRRAEKHGYRLVKYRVESPDNPLHGLWRLDNTRYGGVHADKLTLDAVGAILGVPNPTETEAA